LILFQVQINNFIFVLSRKIIQYFAENIDSKLLLLNITYCNGRFYQYNLEYHNINNAIWRFFNECTIWKQ